jgi:hypothetical protein
LEKIEETKMQIQSSSALKSAPITERVDTSGGRSSRNSSTRNHEEDYSRIVVTGSFPPSNYETAVLIEIIRDPQDPSRAAFLEWGNGTAQIFRQIRRDGRIFLPPDPTSSSFPGLTLPRTGRIAR